MTKERGGTGRGIGNEVDETNPCSFLYSSMRNTRQLAGSEVVSSPVELGIRHVGPPLPRLLALSLESFLVAVRGGLNVRVLHLPGSESVDVSAYTRSVTLYLSDLATLQRGVRPLRRI